MFVLVKIKTQSKVEGLEEPPECSDLNERCYEYIDSVKVGVKAKATNCECKDPVGFDREKLISFINLNIENVGPKIDEASIQLSTDIDAIEI